MKTIFCVLCLGCAIAARGQERSGNSAPTISSHPHQVQFARHPKHARVVNSGSTSAHSEGPLGEVMPPKVSVPLGDTARTLKKKHATAKKAGTVFEN